MRAIGPLGKSRFYEPDFREIFSCRSQTNARYPRGPLFFDGMWTASWIVMRAARRARSGGRSFTSIT